MYEELVKKLRRCGKGLCTEDCPDWTKENLYHTCQDEVVLEAADAIEELSLIAESNERSAARWAETAGKAVEQIEELSKRINRAVELYDRGVERSAMYEALKGISPEPPKEEA